mmetsp:Transcript_61892/g.147658  ORF Transcript_61892/g.147658 Transcript_61892/m.147658 type:complete len:231 (-) Transcript_61892:16-708(-)
MACFSLTVMTQKLSAGSALSRSTSSGSSSSSRAVGEEEAKMVARYSSSTTRSSSNEIPDYDYPVPIIVKNTFLDTEMWRPSSLDGFFQERHVKSCVSRLGAPGGLFDEDGDEGDEQFYDALEAMPEAAAAISEVLEATAEEADVVPASASASAPGPESFPTIGSMAHFDGTCKPCAFFHTKGCQQGSNCEFCHLCDASERKKRRKEKIAVLREMRATDPAAELQQQQQQQ